MQYIKICAKHAQQENRRKITRGIVSARADGEYSSYLKEDLENEIVSVIPDIRYVFDMITFLGKRNFTFAEFAACYMAHMDSSGEAAKVIMRGPSTYLEPNNSKDHRDKMFYILSVLHWYGVIGNSNQSNQPTFRYKARTNTSLNINKKLIIHRGLAKSLSIY